MKKDKPFLPINPNAEKDRLLSYKLMDILEKEGIDNIEFPLATYKWAADDEGNVWTKEEFLDFLINEVLYFDKDGKLVEGYGALDGYDFSDILLEARSYGIVPEKMQQFCATDIVWDTDGEDIDIPTTVKCPVGLIEEDKISDYLSDTYGFCHNGFNLKLCKE